MGKRKKKGSKWTKVRWTLYLLILLSGYFYAKGILIVNYPFGKRVKGIDVSHHNGEINWEQVAEQGWKFAFIKATEGSDFLDPKFRQNWEAARKAGVNVGGYHFFRTLSHGSTQADNFIRQVPRVKGALPPVIDLEFHRENASMTDREFQESFSILFRRLEAHYGQKPILYMPKWFHQQYYPNKKVERLWARDVKWWPGEWAKGWTFWQYSDRGRVKGMSGHVDLNAFHGSRADFEALLR